MADGCRYPEAVYVSDFNQQTVPASTYLLVGFLIPKYIVHPILKLLVIDFRVPDELNSPGFDSRTLESISQAFK